MTTKGRVGKSIIWQSNRLTGKQNKQPITIYNVMVHEKQFWEKLAEGATSRIRTCLHMVQTQTSYYITIRALLAELECNLMILFNQGHNIVPNNYTSVNKFDKTLLFEQVFVGHLH